MRRDASSCCAGEIVVVVTRQPRSRAACRAIPPQPVPISSRWWCDAEPEAVAQQAVLVLLRLLERLVGASKTAHE